MEKEVLRNYFLAFAELTEKRMHEVERISPYFKQSFIERRNEVLEKGSDQLKNCNSIQEMHDTLEGMYSQLSPYWL